MSAIGRVFIVLNLVLAAAFVGFAGTFLQRHTDYKAKFDAATTSAAEAATAAAAQFDAKVAELRDVDRELRAQKSLFDRADGDNKALRAENAQLTAQLADLAGDVKNISSQTTTMAQEIERSREQSKQAYDLAVGADREKASALDERESALTQLAEVERQMEQLRDTLAQTNARLAEAQQAKQEADVMVAMFKSAYPGIVEAVTPDFGGVVHQVDNANTLLTVRVTDNPGSLEVKPGYSFAIFDEDLYKGEAIVQATEGEFAFCRMSKRREGASISIGDRARTNLTQ